MRLPHLAADEPTRLLEHVDGDHGGESFIDLFEQLRAQKRGLIAVSATSASIDLLAGAFRAARTADATAWPTTPRTRSCSRR